MLLIYTSPWFLFANCLAFVLFGVDKHKAKRRTWRIPEKTLFSVAVLGGGVGALLGMTVFRHKTKHPSFRIGIPVCIILNAITAAILLIL